MVKIFYTSVGVFSFPSFFFSTRNLLLLIPLCEPFEQHYKFNSTYETHAGIFSAGVLCGAHQDRTKVRCTWENSKGNFCWCMAFKGGRWPFEGCSKAWMLPHWDEILHCSYRWGWGWRPAPEGAHPLPHTSSGKWMGQFSKLTGRKVVVGFVSDHLAFWAGSLEGYQVSSTKAGVKGLKSL